MSHSHLAAAAATHCIAAKTRKAARAVTAHYNEKLRATGLKVGQFSLLVALQLLDSPTLGSLAEVLGMDRTTVNRNLKPLERDKLVQSIVDKNDARSRKITLTRLGRSRLTRALPHWQQAQDELNAHLGEELTHTQRQLDALARIGE